MLAPRRTRSSALWCPLDGDAGGSVGLYPFVKGQTAMVAGMSAAQWREFGATLRAVHASELGERPPGRLPVDTFALPSAALVRRLLALTDGPRVKGAAAARLAAYWRGRAERIHGANVLVGEDGRIWLVDWDDALIAPREHDLLFVVRSRIAGVVEPGDEARFFEGYGPVEVDPEALVYYRYERVIEDIGGMAARVLLNPALSEQARAELAELVVGNLAPGGPIDRAETVTVHRTPTAPAS